jgi:hypothetical protein
VARKSRLPVGADQAGENGRVLRTLALIAVVVGLVALTAAACVLSYSSVHAFALRGDISASLAKIYPYICDAMLAVAGCSVLALRGAGLISKVYGWLCFAVLLAGLAASSVAREAGIQMTKRAAEITAAALPWLLVLMAFGLLLALLRHARRRRQSHRTSSASAVLRPARAELESLALEAAGSEPATPTTPDSITQYPTEPTYAAADRDDPGQAEAEATTPVPTTTPEASEVSAQGSSATHPNVPAQRAGVPVQSAGVPTNELAMSPTQPDSQVQPRHVAKPAELQLRARSQRQPPELDRPRSSPTPPKDLSGSPAPRLDHAARRGSPAPRLDPAAR